MDTCSDCGGFLPEGCTCAFKSSDSVLVTPSTSSLTTVSPSARIDPNPDNLVEDVSGLRTPPDPLYIVKPRVLMIKNTGQSFSLLTQTFRLITFSLTGYDTHGMAQFADAIVCTVPGWFHATTFFTIDPNTNGVGYTASFLLNNEREIQQIHGRFVDAQNQLAYVTLSTEVFMEPGDRLSVGLWIHIDALGSVLVQNTPICFITARWNRPPE